MKLLEANLILNRVLITEDEYNTLKDFFSDEESEKLAEEYNYENRVGSVTYRKTDFLQEGASLWIVIDEESEIVYEIIVRKVSFEALVRSFIYEKWPGFNDNLIGIYNYINEYGYILSIENWVEDNNKTIGRSLDLFDLIEDRMKDIKHEGKYILQSAIDMFRNELTGPLNVNITEYKPIEYMRYNPGISRHYSIELTNNLYELIKDMFLWEFKHKCLERYFFMTGDENKINLRSNNEKHINIYLSKDNQKYVLDLAKYEEYEKAQYDDKEYNEFILPEKDELLEIFESLKPTEDGCVEKYDFIAQLLIDTINNGIK